jgi:hypothetical protein
MPAAHKKAQEALPDIVGGGGAPDPGHSIRVQEKATEGQEKASGRRPPALPTDKSRSGPLLEEKTVLLYGPPGIGKSTLASEWAGGEVFFFDTAGELNDIDCFSQRIGDWVQFKEYCWALESDPGRFKAAAIDTVDVLAMFCSQYMRKRLGIIHESDAEWGKGWTMVKEEFASTVAKLASLPGLGLILVGHSKEVEIKTRPAVYNKQVPTLTGGIGDVCVNLPDLVLFVDYADNDERVIHTKPSPYHSAKERSTTPRLPAQIPWPLGRSGYDILKEAWYD